MKHEVEFADTAIALEDERVITVTDEDSEGECRFIMPCEGLFPDVLVVVHTE